MKAIILAGGLGSRLRPLTDSIPKPLLPVAGKPIIQWQMEWLKNAGVKDFVLSIGHLADKVQAVLGNGAGIGVSIRYAIEREPLGTAGALRNALTGGDITGPSMLVTGTSSRISTPGCAKALDQLKDWSLRWPSCPCLLLTASSRRRIMDS